MLVEDFADFVFDGVGAGGFLLEGVAVRKEFEADEVAEVVAGLGAVMVDFAVFGFRGRPGVPAAGLVEDEGVFLAFEGGFVGFVMFEGIEVFEEEEPGGLLGVIEFGGAAGFFAEDVVDVFEGLFEHGFFRV